MILGLIGTKAKQDQNWDFLDEPARIRNSKSLLIPKSECFHYYAESAYHRRLSLLMTEQQSLSDNSCKTSVIVILFSPRQKST